jgi:hypothetical protein
MKHILYEDPNTHKFAVIRLPSTFIEGDNVPVPATVRWFPTRAEALATLSDLFNEDEEVRLEDSVH